MSAFDEYVKKVAEYIEEMGGKGRQVREFDCPTEVSKILEGLPFGVGSQASSGIILRGDTFIELGSPDAGSSTFIVWTDDPSLIRDGKVTLIGPDIQEKPGTALPFGQVLMVGGTGLGTEEHSTLEQTQYISDRIEGYMIRGTSQIMLGRVSKDVAAKGFTFDTLGSALMAIFKSEVPKVQAMEVVFITSSKEDVRQLDEIATQVRLKGKDIVAETWKAKGFDLAECTDGVDCGSCGDKPVCDEIRDVVTVRKKKTKKTKAAAKS